MNILLEKKGNFFSNFSDGEEDEDDEGISERSLRRTPSDDGKNKLFFCFMRRKQKTYFLILFSNLYSLTRF